MQVPEYPPDMPEEMKGPVSSFRCTSVEELRACFPDLPIYTFRGADIVEIAQGGAVPVEHTRIYSSG